MKLDERFIKQQSLWDMSVPVARGVFMPWVGVILETIQVAQNVGILMKAYTKLNLDFARKGPHFLYASGYTHLDLGKIICDARRAGYLFGTSNDYACFDASICPEILHNELDFMEKLFSIQLPASRRAIHKHIVTSHNLGISADRAGMRGSGEQVTSVFNTLTNWTAWATLLATLGITDYIIIALGDDSLLLTRADVSGFIPLFQVGMRLYRLNLRVCKPLKRLADDDFISADLLYVQLPTGRSLSFVPCAFKAVPKLFYFDKSETLYALGDHIAGLLYTAMLMFRAHPWLAQPLQDLYHRLIKPSNDDPPVIPPYWVPRLNLAPLGELDLDTVEHENIVILSERYGRTPCCINELKQWWVNVFKAVTRFPLIVEEMCPEMASLLDRDN
jgi:hypothetical protein